MRKRKFGKGKNAYCAARLTWTFNYANTANGTEYLTFRSVGPDGDGWLPLANIDPNGTSKELCDKLYDTSLDLTGLYEFTRTDDSGTMTLGGIALEFYMMTHQPCCGPTGNPDAF